MRTLTLKEQLYLQKIVDQIDDQEVKQYILTDFDTQLDIVEQELDVEESYSLVSMALSRWQVPSMKESFAGLSYKSTTISLRLSHFHFDELQEKSAKMGINYQKLITMLITQYLNGKITLEV